MTFLTGLLTNASLGILSVSPWVLGVIAVVALALAILLLVGRCEITYVDPEGDYEIYYETHRIMKKVSLHGARKSGKKLIGWSTKPYGKLINRHLMRLTHNTTLYAVWEDVEQEGAVSLVVNYMHSDEDIVIAKDTVYLNAKLPQADDNIVINGWAFTKDGEVVLSEEKTEATFVINLFPVFAEDPIENASTPTNDKLVVDLAYNVEDKNIYKESHYITLNVPNDYEDFDNFTGWSFTPEGELFLDKSGADSVFTVELFALTEEKAEEPAQEVVEEPVQEVVEEPVEEPVQEVVEEPAEEPAQEEELFEEIIEEPMPEEPVQEVVEEPVEEPAQEVVEEVVAEEPAQEETPAEVVEEPVQEEVVEVPAEDVAPTIVPTYIDNEGNKIDIKYSRSFTANLIQSEDVVKDYYSELKNHILSYKGVKSKISWKFDSYNKGRDQLFKMKLRGKTICLYCALNPDDFDKSKYHHEAIDAKIFAEVPMLVKIKSGLGLRKAKELVDIVMANFGIEKDPKAKEVDYVSKYPYEETDPLVARKLIKILVPDGTVIKVSQKPQEEEAPAVEEAPVVVEEPAVEEAVEEVAEEVAPEVVEDVVAEEPEVEVVEEPVQEEVVEEVAKEEPAVEPEPEVVIVDEPEEEEEVYEEHVVIVEEVSAEDADAIVEEQHIDIHLEEGVEYISAKDTKKAIINVDTLSENFEPHATVNLAALKAKGLIDKKAKSLKVLARGTLNKPLIVKAGDFSKTAVEMILLTGGNAVHVVYKVK